MRTLLSLATAAVLVILVPTHVNAQQIHASAVVVAQATVAPRPSIVVSSKVLEFRIEQGETQAQAVVDFTAAMRAHPHAEIVLTVEAVSALDGPGGAADAEATVTFAGEGAVTASGVVEPGRASVAAQWIGGGQRRGRLVFTLRASAPGLYQLPVRYLLGTP